MEEIKEQCEEEYKKKGTFKKDHHFICRNTYMNINNASGSGKFFPMRGIRWVSVHHRHHLWYHHLQHFLVRCDMIAQCPNGEDEEGCTIPESVRHIMSLFFFIINEFLIV